MGTRAFTLLAVVPALLAVARDAHANGGLVSSPQGAASIAEVEVAVASAPGRTTRWVRLRVKGSAGAFVWLLPVRPGGMLDLASDAWIESLEGATAPRVLQPAYSAPCAVKGGIDVVGRTEHVATRAPDVVAITIDLPSVEATLHDWGIAFPTSLRGNVETTFAAGSHLALLLFSPASSDTTTRTVRVVDDAPAVLPLLLTSGASGGVAITAFIVGDDRAGLGTLAPLSFDPASITWRADGTSNWRDARAAALGASPNAWLLESAGASPLFQIRTIPGGAIPAITDSYFSRAGAYGDVSADATSCAVSAHGASTTTRVVAAACPLGALARAAGPGGLPTCIESTPTAQLSPDPFRCGTGADDLAHAFSLRVPSGTWVTRATGVVPAGVYGQDVAIVAQSGGAHDAVVQASKYEVTCSSSPGGSGGVVGTSGGGGGSGSGHPDPAPGQGGALVGVDDPGTSDTAAAAGEACSGFAGDGCGGDTSSTDSSSSSSCGGSSSSSSESSSSGCGGSSSSESSSSGCGSSSSSSSSNCTSSRRSTRSPFSRVAIGALALVTLLRRASRRRR